VFYLLVAALLPEEPAAVSHSLREAVHLHLRALAAPEVAAEKCFVWY
jgi:hypothetical protein